MALLKVKVSSYLLAQSNHGCISIAIKNSIYLANLTSKNSIIVHVYEYDSSIS